MTADWNATVPDEDVAAEIALATYNGERFLRPFLASLAAQTHGRLAIVASDDGSTDATVAMLRAFEGPPVTLHSNAGPRGFSFNFNNALRATTAPYVLLADQDDVWMPDKVARMVAAARAVERDRGTGHPVLVISDVEIVDRDLNTLRRSYYEDGVDAVARRSFAEHMYGSVVPGCSMLANRALLDLALPIPPTVPLHDWWMVLLAAAQGTIATAPQPLIKYRQHGSNTLGAMPTDAGFLASLGGKLGHPVAYVRDRIESFRGRAVQMYGTLAALRDRIGDTMPAERRRNLDRLLDGPRLANLLRFRHVRAPGGRIATPAFTLMRPARTPQASSGTSQ